MRAGRRYNGRVTFEQVTYQVRFDWGLAGVTGRATAVRPAAFRVDEEVGAEAVLVRRPHPDAGSGAVSPG